MPILSDDIPDPRALPGFEADCYPALNGRQAPAHAETVLEGLKLQYLGCFYHLNRLFKLLDRARADGVPAEDQLPVVRQVDHWMQWRDGLDRKAHARGLYAEPVRHHGKTLNVRFGEPGGVSFSRPRLRAFVVMVPS